MRGDDLGESGVLASQAQSLTRTAIRGGMTWESVEFIPPRLCEV